MTKWHIIRTRLLLFGLVVLLISSVLACSQPAQMPSPSLPPTTKPAQVVDNKSTGQTPLPTSPPSGNNWNKVQTFTGNGNQTTPTFYISSSNWRIVWAIDAEYPEYAVFDFFVYPAGKSNAFVERASHLGASGDTIYIYEGGQDYYVKVIAANLRNWVITAEESANEAGASSSPVQITYIRYKGTIYPPDPDNQLCYERIEPDEYVEIRNLSDSPQDIRGWILKNENKFYPVFTFPSFFPSPYLPVKQESFSSPVTYASIPPEASEYPKPCILEPYQAIRVYTDEFHPESSGFTFYYGAGDIWDNSKPDVAVLYNANHQVMSRKSYRVTQK